MKRGLIYRLPAIALTLTLTCFFNVKYKEQESVLEYQNTSIFFVCVFLIES